MGAIRDFFAKFSNSAKDNPADLPAPDVVVVGLGNPGQRYAMTRHNIGYLVVDKLLRRHGAGPLRRFNGAPASGAGYEIGGQQVIAVRVDSYMNDSGVGIAAVAKACGLSPEQVLIVHDELDLAPGVLRLRKGGNENGHNGLKSTTEHLGGRDYLRLRVGIGRPPAGSSVVDHVLGSLTEGLEPQALDGVLERAAEAVDLVVTEGLQRAQNTVHQG